MTTTYAAHTDASVRPAVPRTAAARWAAWLLALSPITFVLVIAATAATFAGSQIGTFDTITRAQMDALGFGWALENLLFGLALIVGTVGTTLAAWSLARRGGRAVWSWASVVAGIAALVLWVPYAPLRVAAAGFTEPTLGQNPLYTAWDLPYAIAWFLVLSAVVLLCAAQFTSTRHTASAVVVGALAIVVLLCSAVQLALPPFIVALLWCTLGIVWIRSQRRTARQATALAPSATAAAALE